VFISEHGLLDIFWSDEKTKEILKRLLGLGDSATKAEAENLVLSRKGFLISTLFYNPDKQGRKDGYHRKVSLQESTQDTKFKMKGTICTNGLILNLLAYDITQLKPRSDFKAKDDTDIVVDLDQMLELEDGFLSATADKEQGEVLSELDYGNINFKRGSKLLENVEVKFDKPERCPSPRTTTIVGCDPGIVNPLTFSQLDPGNPHKRETVKITSKFLNFPVSRFRQLLVRRKKEYEIDKIESSKPSFGRDTMDQYFRWVNDSGTGTTTNLDKLQHFYEHLWYLRKSWDLQKAQRATYDHVVQRVLRMLGPNGVLVIGLGSFESDRGVPSKHTSIMRHLIVQVSFVVVRVIDRFASATQVAYNQLYTGV
jgi:hypothetical protein